MIPVYTPTQHAFEPTPHVDPTTYLESYDSIDITGGQWYYGGAWITLAAVNSVGAVATPYIVATIDPYASTGTIAAQALPPTDSEIRTKRLLVTLDYEIYAVSGNAVVGDIAVGANYIAGYTRHQTSDIVDTEAGNEGAGRWTISVNGSGYVTVGDGIWDVGCQDYGAGIWAEANALELKSTYALSTANADVSAAGTYYVIAVLVPDTSWMREPFVGNTPLKIQTYVSSSVFTSPFATAGWTDIGDRNWRHLGKIVTTAGGVSTVEQWRDDDIEDSGISLYDDANAWETSDVFTWMNTAHASIAARPLLQYDKNTASPAHGRLSLGPEWTIPEYSKAAYLANADGIVTESEGPPATGIYAALDSTYGSTGYSDKEQSTLRVVLDSGATATYPWYFMGLYGLDNIPTGTSKIGSYACYFKNDGGADSMLEAKGHLAWSAFDGTRTGDTPRHQSISAIDNSYIEVFGFNASNKWSFPWATDDSGADKQINWGQPLTFTGKPAGAIAPPLAADLWTDVALDVSDTGQTLTYKLGAVGWGAPTFDFTKGSVTQTFDPIGAWQGVGGSFCDDVQGCLSITSCQDVYDCLTATFDHGSLAGLTDDDHTQYLELSGPSNRNNMSGDIGDYGGTVSIRPDDRSLYDGGFNLSLDWSNRELYDSAFGSTLNWLNRSLQGGDWSVLVGNKFRINDTTDAAVGDGALICYGGGTFQKKIRSQSTEAASATGGAIYAPDGGIAGGEGCYFLKGTASSAGYFSDGGFASVALVAGAYCGIFDNSPFSATLASVSEAGYFQDSINNVKICDGTGAINVVYGDYYHLGVQGATASDNSYVSGGLMLTKAGKTLTMVKSSQVDPDDMVAVWR